MVLNNTKSSSKFDNCLIRSIKMRYLQHLSVFSFKTIAFLIIIFSTTFESNAFDDRLLRLVGWLPPLTMFHSVSFRLLLFFFSPTTRIHVYHKRVHIFSLSHFYQNWDLISENGCGPRIHASPSQYKHPNSAQRLRSDSWYIKKNWGKNKWKTCSSLFIFSVPRSQPARWHSSFPPPVLFHHADKCNRRFFFRTSKYTINCIVINRTSCRNYEEEKRNAPAPEYHGGGKIETKWKPNDVRKGTSAPAVQHLFFMLGCQFGMVELTLITGQIIRILEHVHLSIDWILIKVAQMHQTVVSNWYV